MQLALWGDLSVKWNNATTQQADAFCVCGYCGSIINNVLLPNSPNKIAPWGQPTPVGTGPGGGLRCLSLVLSVGCRRCCADDLAWLLGFVLQTTARLRSSAQRA